MYVHIVTSLESVSIGAKPGILPSCVKVTLYDAGVVCTRALPVTYDEGQDTYLYY